MPTFLICPDMAMAMRGSEHQQADESEDDQGGEDTEDEFFLFGNGQRHGWSGGGWIRGRGG